MKTIFTIVLLMAFTSSSIAQVNWTKYEGNPVMEAGTDGSWNDAGYGAGDVLFDGETYHGWVAGTTDGEIYQIGYFTSSDGINWTEYEDNPVLKVGEEGNWDDQYAGFGTVVIDTVNHLYKMWYGGGNEDVMVLVGYATTPSILNVPNDFETIQSAIDAAHDGNIIRVEEGTYYENINFKGKAITVASHFFMDGDTSHISKTIIDGSQKVDSDSGSVVYFISGEDTTSVLCGFTITGGSGSYHPGTDRYGGGGIVMLAGGKIIHNKITGNHIIAQKESYGAGLIFLLLNANTNLVISHNEFTYNSVISPKLSGGGGLYLRPFNNNGYMQVDNNTISYNSVTCTGTYKAIAGGLGVSLELPTVENVIIEKNTLTHNRLHCEAGMGAGIYVVYWERGGTINDDNPTPLIYNNIIADNYSEDKGAGIGIWTVENNHQANSLISPQPLFVNNTIVNNKASDGSGVFNFDSYPVFLNSILWNDLSITECREIFNDNIDYPEYHDHINGGEVSLLYCDIQGGWSGEGNIDADPLFSDTLYHLSAESPCIDAGHDSSFFYDVGKGGVAEWPAMGTLRNDQGAYGGPLEYDITDLRNVLDYITGIGDMDVTLALTYRLNQNYPNPFNPKTMINYQLPMTNDVELTIYNLLGQKVATLVSEKQKAGHHQVEWNASGFASGIYYYSIKAGEFQDVKKMILLR